MFRSTLILFSLIFSSSLFAAQSTQHDDATSLTGDPSNGALVLPDACPSANPGDQCYTDVPPPGNSTLNQLHDCNSVGGVNYCNPYYNPSNGCSALSHTFGGLGVSVTGSVSDFAFAWSVSSSDRVSFNGGPSGPTNNLFTALRFGSVGGQRIRATATLVATRLADNSSQTFTWGLTVTCGYQP